MRRRDEALTVRDIGLFAAPPVPGGRPFLSIATCSLLAIGSSGGCEAVRSVMVAALRPSFAAPGHRRAESDA
jgi:hypothetical protein